MMLLCSCAKLESGIDHQKKKAHKMEDPNQVPWKFSKFSIQVWEVKTGWIDHSLPQQCTWTFC